MDEQVKMWSRIRFEVTVKDDRADFVYECRKFEHMGLLCYHILKVMDHLGMKEIPARHVVKRWTHDARDILPENLTGISETTYQRIGCLSDYTPLCTCKP